VYFVVGFTEESVDLTALAIKFFRLKNLTIPILVICDEALMERCKTLFPSDVILVSSPNSTKGEDASAKKLHIFEAIQNMNVERIMYIDSDILVDRNIDSIFNKVTHPEKLYAYYENTNIESHKNRNWSFQNYSDAHIEFFHEKKIYVFNAGFFCFRNTPQMKQHFQNTIQLMNNHVGEQFYEQSAINVYFNKNDLVDGKLINNENYNMYYPFNETCRNKIVHFAGAPGNTQSKLERMKEFLIQYIFMKVTCPKCSNNIIVATV